tara:strand:+ start:1435 stop:1695 length:261 start_codon:yes stop_codon:yes gene_type:complete
MITEAILKINSNAKVVVRGSDIDTCQIEWLEGTTEISKADIKAQIPTVEQELKDQAQAKIDKKASAITKLKALGLDDDEVNAIIGA